MREFLSEQDAARYIGMSAAFLRTSRSRGTLANNTPAPPYHKYGAAVRYDRTDLDAWLAERRIDPAFLRRQHRKTQKTQKQ